GALPFFPGRKLFRGDIGKISLLRRRRGGYRYARRLLWLVVFCSDFRNMWQPSANMALFFKKTTNGRLFTMRTIRSWWHTSPYLLPWRRRGTTLEVRCLVTRRTRVGKRFS